MTSEAPKTHAAAHKAPSELNSKKTNRKAFAAIGAVAASLAAVYGLGALYFYSHFIPGTTLNGEDIAFMTQQDLAKKTEEQVQNWSTKIEGQGFSLELKAADIDLSADSLAFANAAITANEYYAWPVRLFKPQQLQLHDSITLNGTKLTDLINQKVTEFNADKTQPTNAQIVWDEEQKKFVIKDLVPATALDSIKVTDQVQSAAKELKTAVQLGDEDLVQASVKQNDERLTSLLDKVNSYASDKVQLLINGKVAAEKLDPAELAKWISVNTDEEPKVIFNGDAFKAWSDQNLADQLAFINEVDIYGVDQNAAGNAILDAIDKKNPKIDIPVTVVDHRPAESEGAHERGRHVDVNLSTQYARFYDENGKVLWRSYIVSGKSSSPTPTGSYHLLGKARNQTLIGFDQNQDGQPDYKTPVSYWMPFLGNSYGLHDAPWRGNFGGNIHYYYGSHGCVNLPPQKAAELYELIRKGDLVYVHK